ncbi:uncharacterized protein LOC135685719 [Rhopilema esculentum]|uniref:uncharacterized protein LOC135685719 n=1 Tax=Rhopilema esculentum TaxID=499914 RepID=UPI0031DBD2CD
MMAGTLKKMEVETRQKMQKMNLNEFQSIQPKESDEEIVTDLSPEIINSEMEEDGASMTETGNLLRQQRNIETCLVHDLTDNEVREIAIRLDPPGVVSKNWHDLAHYLGFDELERAAFQRAYCGGGSPALNFFISLKTRKVKEDDVEALKRICQTMNRFDVVRYIDAQCNNSLVTLKTKISDLPQTIIIGLAERLNPSSVPILSCWKHIASNFGYSTVEIQSLETTISQPNKFSPTEELFRAVKKDRPDMKVKFLNECLRKIRRNDVVALIEGFF